MRSEYGRGTWLDEEERAYPSGSIYAGRRARAELNANPHNPIKLPYGSLRIVRVGIPDTFSSIPARLRYRGQTVVGYVSIRADHDYLTFTPEANPALCTQCTPGGGCK